MFKCNICTYISIYLNIFFKNIQKIYKTTINQKIESIESDIIAVLGAGNVANSIQDLKKKYYEKST